MRLLRDLLVGTVSSAVVVLLDRVGVFRSILATWTDQAPPQWAQRASLGITLAAFIAGVLTSRLLWGRSALSISRDPGQPSVLSDTAKVPHRVGHHKIHYPVTFAKPPHLNVSVTGVYRFDVTDQSSEGFVIQFQSLLAMSLGDYLLGGCRVRWTAKGIVVPPG
jgi:hypothetical protein